MGEGRNGGNRNGLRIFAGSSNPELAAAICAELGTELGASTVRKFSDGNLFVQVGETVRDKDVYLLQTIGMNPNDEFTELLFWMDACKRASAHSVTAIIPYFGYAKGDKKDEPRVSIRARVCAESIELAGADRVVAMDLHAPQIQGFFKKPVDHIYGLPVLLDHIRKEAWEKPVIVSPDTGFMKQARKFAVALDWPVAIGDKVRKSHDEDARVQEIIGEVAGRDCVIVDDFTISGGTLVDLARELRARGARRIVAALSHTLLREAGLAKLSSSPIEYLITTDSIRNPLAASHPKIRTASVAKLFADTIYRIHHRQSLGALFEGWD